MTDLSLILTVELIEELRKRHDHSIIALAVDMPDDKIRMAVWTDGVVEEIDGMLTDIVAKRVAERLGLKSGADQPPPKTGPFSGMP